MTLPFAEEYGDQDLQKIRFELQKGTNIDLIDQFGQTFLHIASYKRDEGLIKSLIELGAKTFIKDNNRETPLHKAAYFTDSKNICRMLIESNPDFNVADVWGNTPLMIATKKNRIEIVEKGTDFSETNNAGDSILHLSSSNQQIFSYFIDLGVEVNLQNNFGDTPLHTSQKLECTQNLLDHGADPLCQNKLGHTALHTAAKLNLKEILQCLIENAYDVDTLDKCGNTPLLIMAGQSLTGNIIQMLLDKGANPLIKNKNEETAIHKFGYFNEISYMINLLKYGLNVNALDNNGNTPLHNACEFGNLKAIKLLTQNYGGNLNLKNKYGESVLHKAARFCHPRHIDFIMTNSELSVDEFDDFENTAFLTAFSVKPSVKFAQLLVQRGANVNHTNKFGQNAFHKISISPFEHDYLFSKFTDEEEYEFDEDAVLSETRSESIEDAIKFLVESGLNVNSRDHFGNTPLIIAGCNGTSAILKTSFKQCRETLKSRATDEFDENDMIIDHFEEIIPAWALDECSYKLDLIKADKITNKEIVDCVLRKNWFSNGLETIENLIKNKSAVNDKNQDGNMALSMAAIYGKENAIDCLIENGALIDEANKNGDIPLILASKNGNLAIVKKLVEKGANLQIKNNKNQTALCVSMLYDHKELSVFLQEAEDN